MALLRAKELVEARKVVDQDLFGVEGQRYRTWGFFGVAALCVASLEDNKAAAMSALDTLEAWLGDVAKVHPDIAHGLDLAARHWELRDKALYNRCRRRIG